jgi:hypothetical protein
MNLSYSAPMDLIASSTYGAYIVSPKALDAVVDYVVKYFQCEHIRVEINHYKDSEGNLKVDNFVKTVYTNKGFRWKTLINDPVTGKRA